ncbi:biliverdin-producing heme oxygenase [Pseudorhodoplanes sinuspersici]|uniref:Biliverdin-producing heme oxygenase n=1 Tax=Pseudorhodoplanes sinuspersici TaxID=1235591 RepID=A0A1W6ZQ52_9HYPH|nr:biliverdin-producing heme oxygenase [Pseudorhodoplanes sinuspersici]ARP99526.1 biliverdin-producing heme oxygenase [Pseudorhodoplanes sinuspersici]RKE70488.1 heme oxygenase [Pseudorhodoplanes sinuspersici]
MTTLELDKPSQANRAALLKQATHEAHESLDKRIMQSDPFADRARYGLFLQAQYLFHREIDALYGEASLLGLLPDLAERRRLGQIEQDLADLGLAAPAAVAAPVFDAREEVDLPAALGWLYVAEGSNLGAAFLLKEAAKLGLSETFGARHLAAHPQGRGLHWRTFTAALDSVSLSADDEARAIAGAKEAFARVRDTVERLLPLP